MNLLGAAAVAISDLVDEAHFRVTGLRGEASAALLTIGTRPGRSIEHLRQTVGLSHSGTVRIVDRLEARAWVKREDVTDGREVKLSLTTAGEVVFHDLLAARRKVLDAALGTVGSADGESLERSLASLLQALPATREDAWRICRLCEHGVCRKTACPVGSAVDE